MQITQLKDLGVVTDHLAASRDFYVQQLGFEPVFVSDWYIHLKNGAVELGLMAATPEMRAAPANGVWLSVGVADVDAEYARLKAAGAAIDAEPKDQPWGERSFFVRDPNGFGVNLSMAIPVNEEFMRSQNQLAHASS
jgi:uncharacterized glyoxalase superfamily protein PhnB